MTEKKPTIAGLEARIAEITEANGIIRQDLAAARQARANAEKSLEHANGEISSLKDELHRMTIENARLEGYRDRVLEFDPVTERQQYRDAGGEFQHREHFGAPTQTIRQRRYVPAAGGGVMAFDTYGEPAGDPWYRRRG